jgi:hypothetical protein
MTHPIIPPPELVQQWALKKGYDERDWLYESHIATRAAQWGADQELEACCEWVTMVTPADGVHLRAARRPKPPSLKEQALKTLQRLSKDGFPCNYQEYSDWDTIRRALEALPE